MYQKVKKVKDTYERLIPTQCGDSIGAMREHVARYNFILKYVIDKNVCDAACGSGYGMSLMSYVAKKLTGWEVDKEAIDYCKQLAYYCPTKFKNVDLNRKLPKSKFDVLVSFETVEHLKNPEKFIKESAEVCDTFIFSVPNVRYDKVENEFHLHSFTLEEVKEMFGKYYNNISWAAQSLNGMDFQPLDKEEDAKFFIGIARNI